MVRTTALMAAVAACFAFAAPAQAQGPVGPKPTDATTGPRIPLTTAPGGKLKPGVYIGKRFTSMVEANGPLTLIDCVTPGLKVTNGPVLLDHTDVFGWFGVLTNNLDPGKQVLTARFVKVVGPTSNDTMRIGSRNWNDARRLVNTRFEDSIISSPFNPFATGSVNAHFDLLQFGGGQNSSFERVVLRYDGTQFNRRSTQYVNNGIKNKGVVLEDIWVEGGPVSYVLAGPMTVRRAVISPSTKQYGYVYPSVNPNYRPVLEDVFANAGGPVR
jgi:hypothetical protein